MDSELTKFVGKRAIAKAKENALRGLAKKLGVNCSIGYVCLAIDCSSSMAGNRKLEQVKEGVMEFANDAMVKGYTVGLIKFNDNAKLLCEPVSVISILKEHIQELRANGATYMSKGIKLAHQNLRGYEGNRIIVVATDGMPVGLNETTKKVLVIAAEAKQEGIDIITIGTDDADKEFLSKIASRTELVKYVPSFQFGKAIASAVKMLPAS